MTFLRQILIFGTKFRQQDLYLSLLNSFQMDSTGAEHLELIRALTRECYRLSAFFAFSWP